jgi:TusA-related sulfurtransferase
MASRELDPAARAVEAAGAPADAPRETLDVRGLGPPKPLTETLERLVELDEETVLVQYNDRAPQHLYPKLEDRGYEYGTVETDEAVVTVIWST